jgi:hypothetical protein
VIASAIGRLLNGRLVIPAVAANGFIDAFKTWTGDLVRAELFPTPSAESSAAPGRKLVDAGGLLTLIGAHQNSPSAVTLSTHAAPDSFVCGYWNADIGPACRGRNLIKKYSLAG